MALQLIAMCFRPIFNKAEQYAV